MSASSLKVCGMPTPYPRIAIERNAGEQVMDLVKVVGLQGQRRQARVRPYDTGGAVGILRRPACVGPVRQVVEAPCEQAGREPRRQDPVDERLVGPAVPEQRGKRTEQGQVFGADAQLL